MPFIEANGKRLFYVHRTPPGKNPNPGFTIFMIHGLGSSHSFYLPLFSRLLDAGFSCLAYDTYGSALSGFSGGSQDVKSMSDDACDLLAALRFVPEQIIVVGHSMGGMVACQLASQNPFAGAVLIGPVHPAPTVCSVFAKRIETVQKEGMEAMADTIPEAATGSKSTPTQKAFIRSLLLSQQPEGYISLCKVISEASPDQRRVSCPLSIIAGREDKSAPLQGCQTISDSRRSRSYAERIEILEGVGHWHCIEAPDEVAGLIESFLKSITPQ